MKTTDEKSHSEQQAEAQLESIKEMLRALDKETAAEDYAKGLTMGECRTLLIEDSGWSEYKRLVAANDIADTDAFQDVLRARVAELIADGTIEPEGFEFDEEEARERIQEDPLEITVRSDWHAPGDEDAGKAAEYCILLCTGGPAVRIIGDLSEHGEPESARLQHQDWGTSWQELICNSDDRDALVQYAQHFFFGE